MTTQSELKPWLDDHSAPDDLRDLLSFARTDGPEAEQLQRFSLRMAAAIGAPASALLPGSLGATAPAQPVQAFPSIFAKAGVMKSGALWGKLLGSTGLKLLSTAAVMTAGLAYWSVQPKARTDTPPRAQPSEVHAATPVATREQPSSASALTPAAPVVEAAAPVVEAAAPGPSRVAPARRVARTRSSAQVTAARPTPTPVVPSELELIKAAQAAHGHETHVLALLGEHQRAYPHGMLAQEREVLAIEALLAAGRRPEAEARAAQLEAAYPGRSSSARARLARGARLEVASGMLRPSASLFALATLLSLGGCGQRVSVVGHAACSARTCDGSAGSLPIAWDASFERPGKMHDLELLAAELKGTWWGVVRWQLSAPSADKPPFESLFELDFEPSSTDVTEGSFAMRCVGQSDCDPLLIRFRFSSPNKSGHYELVFVNQADQARGSFSNALSTDSPWELPFEGMQITHDGTRTSLAFSIDFGGTGALASLGDAVLVQGHAPDGGVITVTPPPQPLDAGTLDAGPRDAGTRPTSPLDASSPQPRDGSPGDGAS